MVLRPPCASWSPGELPETQIAGPHLESLSQQIRVGLRICVSKGFPGDGDAAGGDHTLRTTFLEKLSLPIQHLS